MSETQIGASPAVQATPKKSATSTKSKKPARKSSHPRTSEMVTDAIAALQERGGSSIQAIKKYIVGTYMLDAEKQAPFIKKYLKTAVEQGQIIQTKGKGASGSFKLAKSSVAKPKAAAQKSSSLKKPKSAAKKMDTAKKTAVAKKSPVKKPVAKKPVAKKTLEPASAAVKKPAARKAPAKSKKPTKSPTAKPKAPKPKTKAAK